MELPLFDGCLRETLDLLGVDNVLNVLTSVLLEHQVLLYSEGESMCSRVCSWSTKCSSTRKVSQCAHECAPGAPSAPLL